MDMDDLLLDTDDLLLDTDNLLLETNNLLLDTDIFLSKRTYILLYTDTPFSLHGHSSF